MWKLERVLDPLSGFLFDSELTGLQVCFDFLRYNLCPREVQPALPSTLEGVPRPVGCVDPSVTKDPANGPRTNRNVILLPQEARILEQSRLVIT